MWEEHPIFVAPSNPDAVIWRYMDLPKLIDLLTRKSLWFGRADTLGDAHEGAYGPYNQQLRPTVYKDMETGDYDRFLNVMKRMTSYTYVSCWHLSDVESVAMWNVYAASGSGVAVRSTYARLTDSLRCQQNVFVGKVNYVDPSTTWIPEGNLMWPFVHKRLSFEYERELRALMSEIPIVPNDDGGTKADIYADSPLGISAEIDLGRLIEAVYVAPGQPPWYRNVVADVVTAFAPGTIDVRQSDLDRDPIY